MSYSREYSEQIQRVALEVFPDKDRVYPEDGCYHSFNEIKFDW